MARSVRHLTETAALLDHRCVDLVVLKQGIDTTTPAGRFLFHVIAAMDEMLADVISEGTLEGLEAARARGRTGSRKPKLSARPPPATAPTDPPTLPARADHRSTRCSAALVAVAAAALLVAVTPRLIRRTSQLRCGSNGRRGRQRADGRGGGLVTCA